MAVSVVITACGRPDLLEKTISSFVKWNTYPITQWIISEDSGIPNIKTDVIAKYPLFTWIATSVRRGQIKSIDDAYSFVKTPYVFHLEEDWETYADGAIQESITILEKNPRASAVMCRAHGEGGYKMSSNPPFLDCWGQWGYYSFNPGLRRMSDIKELFGGSFSTFTSFDIKNPLKSEIEINARFQQEGFKMAMTSNPAGHLKHIGEGRHVGATLKSGPLKLGLAMIVKDESHIIEETLNSIYPLIDCYAITDTGSTDNTIEIIETFFQKKGIPGTIFRDTWDDFGTNRTRALNNCSGLMDYILMIDADDLIVFPPRAKEQIISKFLELDVNGGMLVIRQGDLEYNRMQIFKANDDWKYVGVLHEYPTNGKLGNRIGKLPGVVHMISRRLGNRSKIADKYARDAEILEKALLKEPENERYVFYLAQSYRDCGNTEKAVEFYTKRYEMEKWVEESYFSAYQIARLTNSKEWAWKAFERNPKRNEALCHYLSLCRTNSKWSQEAYAMARCAAMVPLPTDQHLFVETDAYKWRALDEFSIHSYYTGHTDESLWAYDKLLREELFPEIHRLRIMQNRRFSIDVTKDPSDIKERKQVWDSVMQSIKKPKPNQTVWENSLQTEFSITIVEPRCHEHLQGVLWNMAHVYGGKKVALYIFHGTQNKKFIKDITRGWSGVQYVNTGVANFTWKEYSRLLTTYQFWEKIKTKHTLIMQTDSLLLTPIPDKFFEYEYVGAPNLGPKREIFYQNGGFSLRNVSKMYECSKKDGPETPGENGCLGEDIFFGCRSKMPVFLEATEFSVESFFRKTSVGTHQPWRFNSVENLKCLLSNVPGA
jgi:glycosyltransferase involved in cell wall biosynthesis